MCIKSIVAFSDFNVEEDMIGIKTKKGCRKIKAATLEKVRHAILNGETIGHAAFWVCVPLPEAHTTHDLNPVHSQENEETEEEPPVENMDAITHILNVAAQYGGKVHILQKGDENIIEFQLNDTSTTSNEQNNDDVSMEIDGDEQITNEQILTFKEESIS